MSLDQRRKEGGGEAKPSGGAAPGAVGAAGAAGSAGAAGARPPQPAHKQTPKDKDDKPKEDVKVSHQFTTLPTRVYQAESVC